MFIRFVNIMVTGYRICILCMQDESSSNNKTPHSSVRSDGGWWAKRDLNPHELALAGT